MLRDKYGGNLCMNTCISVVDRTWISLLLTDKDAPSSVRNSAGGCYLRKLKSEVDSVGGSYRQHLILIDWFVHLPKGADILHQSSNSNVNLRTFNETINMGYLPINDNQNSLKEIGIVLLIWI